MQRLQTRPQFQAVLSGVIVAKTEHFVLHRNQLGASAPVVSKTGRPAKPVLVKPDHKHSEQHAVEADAVKKRLFEVEDVWLGAMVPKRWAKRAVTRNAIKRQIYAVSADFSAQFPRLAFVVRLRREFSRKQFVSAVSAPLKDAVRAEVSILLRAGIQQP